MNPYFIFDFDGTLVDCFDAAMNLLNRLADEFHFRKIESNELETLRDLTSKEILKYLKIPFYKVPTVLSSARDYIREEMKVLLPFEKLPWVLQELHAMKIPMGILTSNSSTNVREWLKRNHLHDLFQFIHCESSYFGKKYLLKKLIKTYKMNPLKTCYIGDETRDIDAAKKCGIYSAAVVWGFNSEKILAQQNPHFIIRKPEDILALPLAI